MSDTMEGPKENAENVLSSSRERVPTKKGLVYQTELLQRDGDSALKAWKQQLCTYQCLPLEGGGWAYRGH